MKMKCFINLLVLACFVAGLNCTASEIAIVTNPTVSKEVVNHDSVKAIFSGKMTKWPDNQNIILAVMEGTDLHKDFLNAYVNKSEIQFRNTWRKMIFTGQASYPQKFDNSKDLLEFVKNTKGAIGYVNADANTNGVNVMNYLEFFLSIFRLKTARSTDAIWTDYFEL